MAIGSPNPAGSGASPGATNSPPASISEGSIIAGRYRVLALLGEGTTGSVYRVEHVHIRKIFALKLLHAKLCGHQQVIARFEREAIAAASIEHPNVVHATDFGSLPDGSFFLVLEFVDGRDLRSELEHGTLEMARVIHIMRGVVAGIRAAHEKGIIHRDLKPENIMLIERDGTRDFVKLLDFGIARMESPTNTNAAPLTIV
ncbi:MAG TPA: serine/threonine-protein kinase, partial [Polyangiaceae bacterium]